MYKIESKIIFYHKVFGKKLVFSVVALNWPLESLAIKNMSYIIRSYYYILHS